MLNDRQRHALNELERELVTNDPAWARQFVTFIPSQLGDGPTGVPTTTRKPTTSLTILIVIAVIVMLLGAVFGNPQVFVAFWGTALILSLILHYR